MAVGASGMGRQHERSLERLESVAKLMDGIFIVPGTNIRIGLDSAIGLLPGVGDLATSCVAAYLIWEAHKLGAPKTLLARMIGNALIDTTIGAVPILGDAFDVMFRSNMKNMALLREHLESVRADGRYGPIIEGEFTRSG